MTTQTPARTRSFWKETSAIMSNASPRALHSASAGQPEPVAKSQAENEAERWVAQMMFENYNSEL